MTLSEMWELYDKMDNSKFQKDVLEMICSIEDIYEQGFWRGNDLNTKMNSGSCFVYFISCGELMKIGVANNVPNRLKQLQTSNPLEMQIFHVIPFNSRKEAFEEEWRLHSKYALCRVNGEWFDKETIISEEFISI